MSEYIEKSAFIDFIDAGHLRYATEKVFSENDVVKMISEQPAADVEPVVRGEWRVTDAYPHRVYCSLCHKTNVPNEESLFERNEYPKFCMWCGAKMEGEKEGV